MSSPSVLDFRRKVAAMQQPNVLPGVWSGFGRGAALGVGRGTGDGTDNAGPPAPPPPPPPPTTVMALGMLGGQMSWRDFSKERPFRDLALQARTCAHISAFGNFGFGLLRVASMTRASNVVSVVLVNAAGEQPGDMTIVSGMLLELTCFADSSFDADGAAITVTDQTHFTYPNVGADGAANIAGTADVAGAIRGHVPLGANGWPIADHRMIFSAWAGGTETGNQEVVGTYTGTFLGAVPTTITGENCTISNRSGNTFTMAVTLANAGNPVAIRFEGVQTDGSYAGLTLVPQGSAVTVLRPAYKTAMARYTGGQRWMDARLINSNPTGKTWANRGKTPLGLGIPYEAIVAAHNEMGTAGGVCWINVPVCATDDFVTGLANYVRDNLNPAIPCGIEYSNEPWNFGVSFQQYGWLRGFGKKDLDGIYHNYYGWDEIASLTRSGGVATVTLTHNLPASWTTGKHIDAKMVDTNFNATNAAITKTGAATFTYPVGAGSGAAASLKGVFYGNLASNLLSDSERDPGYISERWIAKRIYQIGQLFLASFGALKARARIVYMTQLASSATQAQALDWLATQYGPVSSWLSAIGGAPYSRGSGANVAAILADLNTNVDSQGNSLLSQLHLMKYQALKHNVALYCYEGGTDFGTLNATLTDNTYANSGLVAPAQASVDVAFKGGADLMMYFGTGLRWLGLAGGSTWGQGEAITTINAFGAATSYKQQGLDAALGSAPAAPTDTSRIPGTVRLANGGSDDYDGRSGGQLVNGVQCFMGPNDYFEKLFYAPNAGTFALTVWGKHYNQFNTSNNNTRIYVGQTVATLALQGTIALYDDGTDCTAPSQQGGYASPGTINVTMAKGWNIIRAQGPAGAQPDRVGVSKFTN